MKLIVAFHEMKRALVNVTNVTEPIDEITLAQPVFDALATEIWEAWERADPRRITKMSFLGIRVKRATVSEG